MPEQSDSEKIKLTKRHKVSNFLESHDCPRPERTRYIEEEVFGITITN